MRNHKTLARKSPGHELPGQLGAVTLPARGVDGLPRVRQHPAAHVAEEAAEAVATRKGLQDVVLLPETNAEKTRKEWPSLRAQAWFFSGLLHPQGPQRSMSGSTRHASW